MDKFRLWFKIIQIWNHLQSVCKQKIVNSSGPMQVTSLLLRGTGEAAINLSNNLSVYVVQGKWVLILRGREGIERTEGKHNYLCRDLRCTVLEKIAKKGKRNKQNDHAERNEDGLNIPRYRIQREEFGLWKCMVENMQSLSHQVFLGGKGYSNVTLLSKLIQQQHFRTISISEPVSSFFVFFPPLLWQLVPVVTALGWNKLSKINRGPRRKRKLPTYF